MSPLVKWPVQRIMVTINRSIVSLRTRARLTAKRFVPGAVVDVGRSLGLFGGGEWEYAPRGWDVPSGLDRGWDDPSVALAELSK